MENFIVYTHSNPVTKQVFYVGIASRKDRAYYFKNRNNHWRGYVLKYGPPVVKIIYDGLFKYEAEIIEKFMIQTLGRKGYDQNGTLTNQSLGGGVNVGWRMPEDARRKISEAVKNRPMSESRRIQLRENNPAKTPEAREKIRLSKLGNKHSDETRRKLSENSSSRRPDVAKKISEALKGRVGKLHPRSKPVEQVDKSGNVVAKHESIMQAANAVGGDFRLISAVCVGKRKYHLGFNWRYV